jgi:hypothetical protein
VVAVVVVRDQAAVVMAGVVEAVVAGVPRLGLVRSWDQPYQSLLVRAEPAALYQHWAASATQVRMAEAPSLVIG